MFVDVPSRMLLLVIFGLSAERALGTAMLPLNDIAVFTEGLRLPALLTPWACRSAIGKPTAS